MAIVDRPNVRQRRHAGVRQGPELPSTAGSVAIKSGGSTITIPRQHRLASGGGQISSTAAAHHHRHHRQDQLGAAGRWPWTRSTGRSPPPSPLPRLPGRPRPPAPGPLRPDRPRPSPGVAREDGSRATGAVPPLRSPLAGGETFRALGAPSRPITFLRKELNPGRALPAWSPVVEDAAEPAGQFRHGLRQFHDGPRPRSGLGSAAAGQVADRAGGRRAGRCPEGSGCQIGGSLPTSPGGPGFGWRKGTGGKAAVAPTRRSPGVMDHARKMRPWAGGRKPHPGTMPARRRTSSRRRPTAENATEATPGRPPRGQVLADALPSRASTAPDPRRRHRRPGRRPTPSAGKRGVSCAPGPASAQQR